MNRHQFFAQIAAATAVTSLLISGCAAFTAPRAAAPAAAEIASDEGVAPAGAAGGSYAYEAPPAGPADMFFADYGVRGFVPAARDNRSTFSVDVDTGSYTLARGYLQDGYLPPADAIRSEEFINRFDYGYPNPERAEAFGVYIDGAPSPFAGAPEHRMLRIGIQGYSVPASERPPANLIFVVDVSGSMDMENRLGLAKRALYLLLGELRPSDRIALVVYGDVAREVVPMTPADAKETVLRAISRLTPEGSTNAAAGIELGYEIAAAHFDPAAINRVVLLSDGVANVGVTGPGSILRLVEEEAGRGISLTTIGMGMGNYNDVLMEQLADDGDGFYAYVDTLEEARRVFVDQLTSTLLTIAEDVKVQVEFNPSVVAEYRLVGYENRKVRDDDFRNDETDAGEIGAGHSVTALYELVLAEDAFDPAAEVATVHLRWREPATGEVLERTEHFPLGEMGADFETAAPGFRLANLVAEYAEVLRQSEYGAGTWLGDLSAEVERLAVESEGSEGSADAELEELLELLWLAESMLPVNPASLEE